MAQAGEVAAEIKKKLDKKEKKRLKKEKRKLEALSTAEGEEEEVKPKKIKTNGEEASSQVSLCGHHLSAYECMALHGNGLSAVVPSLNMLCQRKPSPNH